MDIINKYKEIIMYLIFGILTTLVNIGVYVFFTRIITLDEYLSNAIAWILSVLFAYITNRIYVFESKANKFKEIGFFYGSRILTFCIDMSLMFMFINLLYIDDLISKIIVNFVIIVLNYLISKVYVFKTK